MSVKVMGKVWDTDLPPNQRLVLLAYADAAEHDGTEIWPGHERLTAMTGYSRSQVERITRDLIAAGVLVRVTKGYRGRRARFAIPLDHPTFVSQDATQSDPDSVASEADSVASEANEPAPSATRPVLPVPSSTPVLPIAATPRNPWWDVTVELFGEPAANQRSLYGRFVEMVASQTAELPVPYGPREIRRRAGLLAELWGVQAVTVASLEKYWSRFDAQIGQVSDADVEAFTAAGDRAATLERLADE